TIKIGMLVTLKTSFIRGILWPTDFVTRTNPYKDCLLYQHDWFKNSEVLKTFYMEFEAIFISLENNYPYSYSEYENEPVKKVGYDTRRKKLNNPLCVLLFPS
ncbi:15798_t:CDS:1, partial [Acaulospora morrowiae]